MKKNQTILIMLAVAMALSMACNSQAQKDKDEESTNTMLLLAAAASRTTTLPIQGSCTTGGSSCVMDYHTGWTSSTMTTDCATAGGTLTVGGTGCTTTNRVASCYMQNRGLATASGTTSSARYYSPASTVATATTACNGVSGTLTTP